MAALSVKCRLRNFTFADMEAVRGSGGENGGGGGNAAFWMDVDPDDVFTVIVNFEDPVAPPGNVRTISWGDGTPDTVGFAGDQISHTYDGQMLEYVIKVTNEAGDIYEQTFYIPG